MIFNVICIALIAGIAYYHYAQGFFSAALSAIIALIAAVLAVGYQENIVDSIFHGNMPSYSTALALIGLFAIIYILLRTLTDKTIPGNLRLPVPIDRVGGAIMGIFAGIFAVGVFALAAQSMPFGPTIGGFSRYPVEDRPEMDVPPDAQHSQARNVDINAQLVDDSFQPENRKGLWVPADDLLLGTVSRLSDGGSMAGERTLTSIHPDYPTELFGQRLGIQVGANRIASNLGTEQQVSVGGVFLVTTDLTKTQVDDELPQLHERPVQAKLSPGDVQLVVRVIFHKGAKDTDPYVRVSTGAVRLVANGKDFYPVGTLENATTLFTNKPDDFLFIDLSKQDQGADFVFFVPGEDVLAGGAAAPPAGKNAAPTPQKIADGVFIDVKRLARINLGGQEAKVGVTPAANVKVERKPYIMKHQGASVATAEGAPAPASAVGFSFSGIEVNKSLFATISIGSAGSDARNQQIDGGTFSLQSAQFTQLDLSPTRSLMVMSHGPSPISELYVPAGKQLVQIHGSPEPEAGDPWSWGQFQKWEVVDAARKTYKPAGGWARVKKDQTDMLAASYNATGTPKDITSGDGRPSEFWIAFIVPSGTDLKQIKFGGKVVADINQQVP